MTDLLLDVKGISKSFAGVRALDKVSFSLRPGSVHVLCGENGAGKSTLMNILMGIRPRDEGEVLLRGKNVNFTSPKQALEAGMSIIEQELSPIGEMTVAENIFLGREPVGSGLFIDYGKMNEMAKKALQELETDIDPEVKMKRLRLAQVQLVEIAKAISYNSDVIIMDEPTSAIGEKETEKLFKVIRRLKEQGKSFIYITHRMKEIFEIADEITVLRDGAFVGNGPRESFDRNKLISLMIGRKIEGEYYKTNTPGLNPVLQVEGFSRTGEFEDVAFELKEGEILGVFGLMGSGRSEFFNALYGVTRASGGAVRLNGSSLRVRSPRDALRAGLAYVTEDRKMSGLVLSSSVAHNISIASLKAIRKFFFIDRKSEEEKVAAMISTFEIKTPSSRQTVKNLSGGNQQKVVLGRWTLTGPKILLLDEPTRGIDVGAKREIYRFMSDFASQGKSIVMISSELPEILGMSDRIVVFKEGRIAGIVPRSEATQELLMHLAT